MTLLFDISPQEPEKKRPSRVRVQSTPVEAPISIKAVSTPQRAILPIGKLDDHYECADGACGTKCLDILHEDGREWYCVCAFCGTGQWVPVIRGHLKPKAAEFVLRSGNYAGMTWAEVEQQPHGPEYIRWAAASHPKTAVKESAKKHLDSKTAPQ